MPRVLGVCGAALAGLGVAFGAFGAHALRGRLSPERLDSWETAVLYQLVHGLALLLVASRAAALPVVPRSLRFAGGAFAVGAVLFSGSIYLLCLTGNPLFGPVTPLGGVSMLAGWAAFVSSYLIRHDQNPR